METVQLEYLGGRAGLQTFTANGNRYQFGDNALHKVKAVRIADAGALMAKHPQMFKVVVPDGAEQPILPDPLTGAPTPVAKPTVAPPVTQFTVQFDLKGLSDGKKAALADMGILTLKAFVGAGSDALIQILGLAESTVEKMLREAEGKIAAQEETLLAGGE